MYARIATLVAVIAVAFVGLTAPSVAGPVPAGSDPSVMALNRHLATLAQSSVMQKPSPGARPLAGVAAAPSPARGSGFMLSPAILNIAGHFTKAERLLHFQSHGLDANFWGAFNGGRGMKVQYSVKF